MIARADSRAPDGARPQGRMAARSSIHAIYDNRGLRLGYRAALATLIPDDDTGHREEENTFKARSSSCQLVVQVRVPHGEHHSRAQLLISSKLENNPSVAIR